MIFFLEVRKAKDGTFGVWLAGDTEVLIKAKSQQAAVNLAAAIHDSACVNATDHIQWNVRDEGECWCAASEEFTRLCEEGQ